MATLREIRRRITGVKSTQKITKAMKMVAAAKLRRAQEGVIAARPYAKGLQHLMRHIAARVDVTGHPLFSREQSGKVAVIVVTSDRGLCGGFNTNIIRSAGNFIDEKYAAGKADGRLSVFCIGRKGAEFFQKNRYPVKEKYIGVANSMKFETVRDIADTVIAGYLAGEYDRVDVIYNEFKSIVQQRIAIEQYLPIPPEAAAPGALKHLLPVNYIYEPSKEQILEELLPRHLRFKLWHVLLESVAAEQGARMTAMDNATTNASDLIRSLNLSYNKARQASITKELLEIVSGAEALKNTA
jgi:F-type H+-transporting ATPase subunit gamma